ncbi:TIGR03936 family radical SAM-associated protein [Anaerosalibacter sp. Marseille-P3206]|uniref:TIGR03936 family radical SAM-associated protein n=1 Tax=Anaerosalibacter sp. Marseille-P3206 TaxID=1871005 RepID=UPI00190EB032|nr:TIGR03936 family radical SAM-associated protein [Anaerosalibacter sp. Marseille-P3206]
MRVKFTKENYLKYISHLDTMRFFQRMFRMADIPIAYSEGFNPHPKFSIASALSLGISSQGEYMDIELEKSIPVETFIERMNGVLPDNVRILDAKYTEDNRSISSLIRWGYYNIQFEIGNEEMTQEKLEEVMKSFLSEESIIIKKEKRKRKKLIEREVNIRPQIGNVILKAIDNNVVKLNVLLKTGDSGNLKPTDFLKGLAEYTGLKIIDDSIKIHRVDLYTEEENKIVSPL